MKKLEQLLKNDDDLPFKTNIEAESVTNLLRDIEQNGHLDQNVCNYVKQWIKFNTYLNMYEDDTCKKEDIKQYSLINEILETHHGQYHFKKK